MSRRSFRGFSLIEILIAIAIIGILSSVVLASLNTARGRGQQAHAREALDNIRLAMNILAADTGFWPGGKTIGAIEAEEDNEIWDLGVPTAGLVSTSGSYPEWDGPYIPRMPLDPWGNQYFLDTDYQVDDDDLPCQGGGCRQVAVLGSFGPNGIGPNAYDSDDIIIIIAE